MAGGEEAVDSCRTEVVLQNSNGLHARPAHMFVQTANAYAADLLVGRPELEMVDGKSIMGVMMLAAEKGTKLHLVSEGADCREQIRALTQLIDERFGEE
ncbi:MAG: HPr family phosphocarrier protein [Planctomycetota bacterium]|jgi:phosphocarrier protein